MPTNDDDRATQVELFCFPWRGSAPAATAVAGRRQDRRLNEVGSGADGIPADPVRSFADYEPLGVAVNV